MTEDMGQGDTGADGGDGGDNGGDNGVGGEPQPTFLDSIQSEDLRGNEHLQDFDSPDSLAEKYVELRNSQPVIPETADGYEMEIPEGIKLDEEDFGNFKQTAHDLKLSNEQWEAVVMFDHNRMAKWVEQQEANVKEAQAELTKEWGGKFDENISKANEVLKKTGFEDLGQTVELASNAQFAKFLFHIGNTISEDKLTLGDPKGQGDPRLKDDAGNAMLDFSNSMDVGGS